MIAFFYKWLPIVFGCHCKKERSFHYHGKQFPICARCSGELIGIIGAIVSYYFYQCSIGIAVCLMLPLLIDGFAQLLTKYESGNGRRFITGLLFGYALTCLFFINVSYVYQSGYKLGLRTFR